MKKINKHLIFIYLSVSCVITIFLASKLLLNPDSNIYKYIPADSDIVIEANIVNFIKEIGYQKIYQSNYSQLDEVESDSEEEIEKIINSGINLASKVLIFRENWANEYVWYAILNISNQDNFQRFSKTEFKHQTIKYFDEFAIIQLTSSINQKEVTEHINNIAKGKIKSILSNEEILERFDYDNEINIYLKTKKSEFIADGYLNVNFNKNQIDIDGHFHPIGSDNLIVPINYAPSKDAALSLRSSLNLLNTIYLFNKTKLENLPNYKQLALDYDGAILKTVNEPIPIHVYPNINLLLDIENHNTWENYLDLIPENENIELRNDTILIKTEGKSFLRYKLSDNYFELFQKPNSFTKNEAEKSTYFSLYIQPAKILDHIFFKKDEKNPPKMFANIKIDVIQSVLEEFRYLKTVEQMRFDIYKDSTDTEYLSEGHIIFKNKESHSIVESAVLIHNFMNTIGAFL